MIVQFYEQYLAIKIFNAQPQFSMFKCVTWNYQFPITIARPIKKQKRHTLPEYAACYTVRAAD